MKNGKIIELALFGTSFKMNNGKDAGVSSQLYGMFTDASEPKSVNNDSYNEILLGTEMKNGTFKPNKYFRQELRAAYNNIPLVAVIEYNTDIGDIVYKSFPDNKISLRTNPETDTRKVVLDLTAPVECLHFAIMNGSVYFTVDSNGICNKCGQRVSLQKECSDALAVDSIMKSFSNYNMQNSNQMYYPHPLYQPNPPMGFNFNPGVSQHLNYMPYTQNYSQNSEQRNQVSNKKEVTPKQETIKKCSCEKCSPKDNKIEFTKFSDLLEKIKSVEKFNISSVFDTVDKESYENILMDLDEMSKIFNSVIENIYGDNFPSTEEFRKNIKNIDNEFKKAIIERIKNRN